jgi:hypothetical protein
LGSGAYKQEKAEGRRRRSQFEPMIDYKYPTIASGATPIGSAERAPDKKIRQSSKDEEGYEPLNISTTIKLQLHSRQNIERLLPSEAIWEKLIRNSLIFYQSKKTAT